MDFNKFVELRNSRKTMPLHPDHKRDAEACLAVQIHTTGARPSYNTNQGFIIPETYHKKFDNLFKNRLLNRHPNETPSMYEWRKSIYSPVQKEIYEKALTSCGGSILNRNAYSITADDNTTKAIEQNPVDLMSMLAFIWQNPVSYIGVLLEAKEHSKSETNYPEIVCISCEDVVMYDYHSIAFKYEGVLYFLDKEAQYTFVGDGVVINYHNLGRMPFERETNSFLQPYQNWSDQLARNLSDDETMNKNYTHPFVQIVENDCHTCQGSRTVADPNKQFDPTNPNACQMTCPDCFGRGTTSHNPGEFLTISEETLVKAGGVMQDYVKFISPDVAIPEYHLKRWQVFYKLCESSLHIKSVIDGVQSGDAKKEDRKDQYFFYQSVAGYLFGVVRKNIYRISKLVNPNKSKTEVYVQEPKQFDIMSDSDLLNDFATLQSKTDDSQTLAELNYMVNSKLYRDDAVQKRINEIMYLKDPLFGVSGNALKSKLLSGIYDAKDKLTHEKGYMILKQIANELTPEVFTTSEVDEIISKFDNKIYELSPDTVYSDLQINTGGNLKDSVGGLTGMIEIAKAVASGLYDLDAAVALVSDRFGLSEQEARKQLGTPQKIESVAQIDKIAALT